MYYFQKGRLFACSLALPILFGCSHSTSAQVGGTSAATLPYKLPEAKITVGLNIQITDCKSQAVIEPNIDIQTSVVGGQTFVLRGQALSSWTKSRDLTVSLYDNGTIKSVNAQASDQLGSIIGNLVKTAVSVAAMAASGGPATAVTCAQRTVEAVGKAKELQSGIAALRAEIEMQHVAIAKAAEMHKNTEGISKHIQSLQSDATLLATQLVALQSDPSLSIRLPPQEIDVTKNAGIVSWPIAKYVNQWKPLSSSEDLGTLFAVGFCLSASDTTDCDITKVQEGQTKTVAASTQPTCPGDKDCAATLVFRETKSGSINVIGFGKGFPSQSASLKSQPIIVPQWGEFSYINFSVGFGENRTIGLVLDAYGNKTQLTWKSDARASNIAGSLATVSSSTNDLLTKLSGKDLADEKAEVDQLNTQKSLNQLRACKSILDAGGFSCPTQ